MVFGAQPGVSRARGKDVRLTAKRAAWTPRSCTPFASNEDSMVLLGPEPAAAAMSNLKNPLPLGAVAGEQF